MQSEARNNVLNVMGHLDQNLSSTELHLEDGRVIQVATSIFAPRVASNLATDSHGEDSSSVVIPLVEESLTVGKQLIETAKVRLRKTTHVYEEALDEPLAVRTFDIERIVLNVKVDAAPPVRQEGVTTIYPLVEEQLILTKQLILKEEVRVTRRDTERRDTQVVSLRREHLIVEREELS